MKMELTKISNLQPSKAEISAFALNIKEYLLSGEINLLDADLQLKIMEDAIKEIRKDLDIKDAVLTEAEKFGKSFEYKGCKMQIKEVGVKYDFSVCNDGNWNKLNNQINELKGQLKERETFLKSLKGSLTIADEDTGEVYTIIPPVKQSTTSLSITLNK